jgi:hypothetical protein
MPGVFFKKMPGVDREHTPPYHALEVFFVISTPFK